MGWIKSGEVSRQVAVGAGKLGTATGGFTAVVMVPSLLGARRQVSLGGQNS